MNGKLKDFPHCIDCGYPLLPKPTEERDGCLIKPLVCAFCEAEKDVVVMQILTPRPGDRFAGQAARR